MATIALELSRVGTPPEIHFGWSDESELAALIGFFLFGEGQRALARTRPDQQGRDRPLAPSARDHRLVFQWGWNCRAIVRAIHARTIRSRVPPGPQNQQGLQRQPNEMCFAADAEDLFGMLPAVDVRRKHRDQERDNPPGRDPRRDAESSSSTPSTHFGHTAPEHGRLMQAGRNVVRHDLEKEVRRSRNARRRRGYKTPPYSHFSTSFTYRMPGISVNVWPHVAGLRPCIVTDPAGRMHVQ